MSENISKITGVTQEYLDEQQAFWEEVAAGNIQPAEPTAALNVLEWISYVQAIHENARNENPDPLSPDLVPQEPSWVVYEVADNEEPPEVDVDWQIDDEEEAEGA